jgi:uncharacterized protein YbcV (DUF1398 family)
MDENAIIQLTMDSTSDRISFLDAIKRLRNLGVWGYRVDVSSHSKTFFDQTASFHQKSSYSLTVQRQFIKQKIIDAIKMRQISKIDYDQFMEQIAGAGVFDYIVDIAGKKVVYRGLFENYEEKMII